MAALAELGDFIGFVTHTLLELRGVWGYVGEILRQCGILITGSALVLLGASALVGSECGLFGDYALKGLGAQSYVGFFRRFFMFRG